jgi:hypothetical protein
MTYVRQMLLFLAVGFLAGAGLAACGDGTDVATPPAASTSPATDQEVPTAASIDELHPLAQAIATDIIAGGDTPFGRDPTSADCFATRIVESIGAERLNELGFTLNTIPDEFLTDWNATEVDTIIESIDHCIDIAALTRETWLAAVSDEDTECVLGEIGDDFYLDFLRAQLEAELDEAAAEAALEAATEPWRAALWTCRATPSGDSESSTPPPDDEEFSRPDPSSLAEAVAPHGIGEIAQPSDSDGITALFNNLPGSLLGEERTIEPISAGQLWATYGSTQPLGCGMVGIQAMKVSEGGFYPQDWTAEHVVTVFASGADWDVTAAGRDGDLYWLLWETTCSSAVSPDEDSIFSATWGRAGDDWVYSAAASDPGGVDQLLAAFVTASE